MNTEKPQSSRFEHKFVVSTYEHNKILFDPIFLRHFVRHHSPRYINNLYFDDLAYSSLWHNVEGLSERKKFRVRWYGNELGTITVTAEQKIKTDNTNYKRSLHLGQFVFENHADSNILAATIKERILKKDNPTFNVFTTLIPTLINRYHRTYYITKDCKTRLTIDTQLHFYNAQLRTNKHFPNVIIEAKSDMENPIFMDFLPLQLGKSSKYVVGII